MILHPLKPRFTISLSFLAALALLLPAVSLAQATSQLAQDKEPVKEITALGEFHHAGVPTTVKHENEIYVAAGDVYITDPRESPAGIAWLRWGIYSDAPAILREQPYLAFKVKDLDAIVWKHRVLVEPLNVMNDMRIAFVMVQDAVIGLVEDSATPAKRFGSFHHVGVPTTTKAQDEQYVSIGNVYVTDPMRSPARIAMLRWASYSPAPEFLRKQPYIAFQVKDLEKTLKDKKIVVEPVDTPQGWRIAFIDYMGIPVGLIQE